MFGNSAQKRFIIGAKQVKNAILSGIVSTVYIASDSDEAIIKPIAELAEDKQLQLLYISTRRELGEMCGIDVKASCAAQTL